MTYAKMQPWLENELREIQASGLYKDEQIITTPQGPEVSTLNGSTINFCSNNYLGLANHPDILDAVAAGVQQYGFGMASVRFICGTHHIHKLLEQKLSEFLCTEDTILYNSCFDANAGLFGTLLGPEDALISDGLNHASIVDGVRLCRAKRQIYGHNDMADLAVKLAAVSGARFRIIATDGIFSMEGDRAPLADICQLADDYEALVMVDDSHATGFLGPGGRGTPAAQGVADRIDILTSTLGKALGGASGGFTTGRQGIIDLLRQRSRNYLFSNTIAPPVVIGSLKALEMVQKHPKLRETLWQNTDYFRKGLASLGFDIVPGNHPIVPIMLRDELKTVQTAKAVNDRGVLVSGFSYPVVPKGEARIRVQLSAAHSQRQLDRAIAVFSDVGRKMGVI